MLRVLLSLALVLLIGLSAARADDAGKKKDAPKKPKKSVEEIFKAKDKDNDGKLSLEELKGKCTDEKKLERIEKRFKAKDKDGDGLLTLEEFKAKPEKKKGDKKKKASKEKSVN